MCLRPSDPNRSIFLFAWRFELSLPLLQIASISYHRLWVQSDNTVKEVKNSVSASMMSSLLLAEYFEEAGHHHLPVGHTHEDIDAFFGLVTALLTTAGDDLQTPQDFVRMLETKISPMYEERNEFFNVVLMDRVHLTIFIKFFYFCIRLLSFGVFEFYLVPRPDKQWAATCRYVLGKRSCRR